MNLSSQIEALLFVRGESLAISSISQILGVSVSRVKEVLGVMTEAYCDENRGIRLFIYDDKAQLVTKPEHSEFVERLIKKDLHGPLSKSALEVLAIVAYRGPVSRPAIEAIRGVNCQVMLRTLMMRGLVSRKASETGSAFLYSVSAGFLKRLGVSSVSELPDFSMLSSDKKIGSVLSEVNRATGEDD
ncbi:MAG: SMC-Scp complex subunit ScpB [Candidatus Moranbacteria bacterium]|nr:SMC-Scp complex subunit ScpB [Candidatus Moranbacteria bacterium]